MLKLMPTKLDRIQVLFNKDLFNKLRLLARIERRSLSSMVGSIVEDAIKSNKYQSLLSKAKANDLKSEIKESKSVIKEILQSEISNELDFDANSKLKKLDAILSLISETKKEFLEEPLEEDLSVKDLLVEDALKPQALIEEIQSNTDYKINKMNEMLQKIQQK
tara:strand:- start:805 stop:1293 length:489 start_codon:yes stop_codon:yes gene_type:complete